MILYLDASALVKFYVIESGSEQVTAVRSGMELVGTSIISRAEVVAALAKSVRMGVIESKVGLTSLQSFRKDWADLMHIQITESLVARADVLAWEHQLRGFDAVHLAAAVFWQETIKEAVTLATFDQSLWQAAKQIGMIPFPTDLPKLLSDWKAMKTKRRKK